MKEELVTEKNCKVGDQVTISSNCRDDFLGCKKLKDNIGIVTSINSSSDDIIKVSVRIEGSVFLFASTSLKLLDNNYDNIMDRLTQLENKLNV